MRWPIFLIILFVPIAYAHSLDVAISSVMPQEVGENYIVNSDGSLVVGVTAETGTVTDSVSVQEDEKLFVAFTKGNFRRFTERAIRVSEGEYREYQRFNFGQALSKKATVIVGLMINNLHSASRTISSGRYEALVSDKGYIEISIS